LGEASEIPNRPRRDWQGMRVLVFGLGRFGGGVGVTRWLAEQGAVVTVTDQAAEDSLQASLEAITDLSVKAVLGGHEGCDLGAFDLVVVNPAVDKRKSPFFKEIATRRVPWTTEVNLFLERCPARVIGVTGSYGKSTTCAMLTTVLERATASGWNRFAGVHLGGNFGGSLLGRLGRIAAEDVVVMELSNAQLEDLPRIGRWPDWAVITNLHPHHLDRHETVADYYSAKLKMVRGAAAGQAVIAGDLDPAAERMLLRCLADRPGDLQRVPDGQAGSDVQPIKLDIPGRHNQANARCVLTLTGLLGVDDASARAALASFPGLPHRLETVTRRGGVRYVNDSKSTSPDATRASIEAIDGPLICIVGGMNKPDVDYTECARALATRCRAVIAVGESHRRWAEAIHTQTRTESDDPIIGSHARLEDAVAAATRIASEGDTVLFSPGAPSFDTYANFAERGEHFKTLFAD